jgi:hypothetical protein
VASDCVRRKGGGCLWISGSRRAESVGEVGVPISCLDGLFKVDDGYPVDVEGAFASVDDAVDDGFDAVCKGCLVTGG